MSAILAKIIDLIPGLHLRASEEAELFGMDDDQHGEFAYDYVEVTPHPSTFPFFSNPGTNFASTANTPTGQEGLSCMEPAEKDQREDGDKMIQQHGIEEHQTMMNGVLGHNETEPRPRPRSRPSPPGTRYRDTHPPSESVESV